MKKKAEAAASSAATDNERVTQAAGVVGAATLLTRILGYVRDMVIATLFGAGMVSDAFIAAFRIPNLLRRLFGEGSLGAAFVPVFTDTLNHGGKEEAEQLALASLRFLGLVLVGLSIIGVLIAPAVVHILAYGFTDDPQKYTLTVKLTRIMFPYCTFIGLLALCMGILNVLGHFATPALAPLVLNISMIGMVMVFSWLSPSMATRVTGLALGVLVGGVLQLGIQVPVLIRKGIRIWKSAPFWHPAMRQIFGLMGPVLFGSAVYQINTLLSCLLASLLPQGSVSYLYYADRLVQFPLGVFALAMATAVFPTLSRQASIGRTDALRDTFVHAVQLISFITLPSMVGLIILREPIVAVLFQRGVFDDQTTQLTASAVLYYGIGLWAFSIVRILIFTFYALKDTHTPVLAATTSIVANILLGVFLMQFMRHNGLALAFSLASMLHLSLLIVALRKKVAGIPWRVIGYSLARSGFCSALMGVAVWIVESRLGQGVYSHGAAGVGVLAISMIAGIAVFGAVAGILKIPELQSLIRLLNKRTVSS